MTTVCLRARGRTPAGGSFPVPRVVLCLLLIRNRNPPDDFSRAQPPARRLPGTLRSPGAGTWVGYRAARGAGAVCAPT
eukprot:3172327-Prymnesium_polylepis.4